MCEKRFGTINPSSADWQTEFVTGTGITSENKDLWDNANNRFADYIADLWGNGENVHQTGAWKIFAPKKEGE